MARTRQPRTTQTDDLSATLRSAWHHPFVGRVLNLSAGGMLLANSDLEVGEITHFELDGPGFQFMGLAAVVRRTGQATGVRFLSWEGPVYRPLCLLIAARPRGPVAAHRVAGRDPRVPRRVAKLIATPRTLERRCGPKVAILLSSRRRRAGQLGQLTAPDAPACALHLPRADARRLICRQARATSVGGEV